MYNLSEMFEGEFSGYNIILADCPWSYNNTRTGGSLKSGATQKYPTLCTEDLCKLPFKQMFADDSVLFLWATVPMLPDALKVMNSWGFTYKTKVTWHKIGRFGLGFWFRGAVEELLIGIRGNIKPFRCQKPNIVQHPVLRHSEKPEVFRNLVEEVTKNVLNPKKLELFSRRDVCGWICVGNELLPEISVIPKPVDQPQQMSLIA